MQELQFSDDDDEPMADNDEFINDNDEPGPDSDADSDSDSDAPITAKNMERKSKALDQRAALEEARDLADAAAGDRHPDDHDDVNIFDLPTAEERELEKTAGGPQVQEVHRRIQDCVRVLNDFKKLASKGRSRSEYVEQLLADMADYYGYNEFLTEKLFSLFPVSEVSLPTFHAAGPFLTSVNRPTRRPSSSSKPTRSLGR